MDKKYLVIMFNPFDRQHKVVIAAPGQETVELGSYTMEELPSIVVDAAYATDTYDVKIMNGGKFSQLIEYGIDSTELTKYSTKKIEIEVM